MRCARLAGNTGHKKSPFWHHRTSLSGCIFATKACINNRKNLNSNSSTCHNMANFGPLTAEIYWRVWDSAANLNRFRDFASLLHGTLVVKVSQTAALNRGRHLYSAGWPSRWALAHILVCMYIYYAEAEQHLRDKKNSNTQTYIICTLHIHYGCPM